MHKMLQVVTLVGSVDSLQATAAAAMAIFSAFTSEDYFVKFPLHTSETVEKFNWLAENQSSLVYWRCSYILKHQIIHFQFRMTFVGLCD